VAQRAATLVRDRRTRTKSAGGEPTFLGIRLECAKCHHIRSESWRQEDSFKAWRHTLPGVKHKGEASREDVSGGEEVVLRRRRAAVEAPRSRRKVIATASAIWHGRAIDRAKSTAGGWPDWITSNDNPYLGPGDGQPRVGRPDGPRADRSVDDLRATNPPSNRPQAALGEEFRSSVRHQKLSVRILTSSVYGLSRRSERPPPWRHAPPIRALRARLRAEVLLDAVCAVAGRARPSAAAGSRRAHGDWGRPRVRSLFLERWPPRRNSGSARPHACRTATVVQACHLSERFEH